MPGRKIKFSIAEDLIAVTPSDIENLPKEGILIVFGNGGNVRITTAKGNEATISLEPKEIIPLIVKKVWATSTTATNIYLLC